MRIRKLELCGFKSFVEPTVLELSPGISGIVGPNGCGKSNLVDALRWVLGEQAPSRLRGDAMEDVIFNGSANRGPNGMAEVSLLLENDGGPDAAELPEHLRDVAEILVTRRYFRDGESEYLINRRPCRLRDITELFLGTGVGTRAYAMIEQGKVDQLVNAKPEDVRLFIEEAAGTTRYRNRRLAAERKMERTKENLARVNDILHEIERNIGFYRRMAKKAEQYRLAQEELRRVELQVARRRYDRLGAELAAIDEAREALRRRETGLAESIRALEEARSDARRSLERVEGELGGRQESLAQLRAARASAEARLEMLEREDRDAAERTARIERERTQMSARLGELGEERTRLDAELGALATEHASRAGELETSLAAATEGEREVAILSEAREEAKNDVVDLLSREADLRNRIATAERQIEALMRRREQVEAEAAGFARTTETLEAEAARLGAERDALAARFTEADEERRRIAAGLERLRAEKAGLEKATLAAAGALAETESRLASAEEIERGYERYQEGVRNVMRRHADAPNGVLGLVAEILEAPPEFEKAVAAALGERLQHVIVRTPEDARAAIEELKGAAGGRSGFIPLETARPTVRDVDALRVEGAAPLLELVQVEEGYGPLAERLLGDAVVVNDLGAGLAIYRRNGAVRTIVTRDGDVVHPSGVISGGSEAPYEEGLLAQRREIRRLREEIARRRDEQTALARRYEEAERELAEASARDGRLEETLRELSVERMRLGKDAERAGEALDRGRADGSRARAELEELARELEAIAGEGEAARSDLASTAESRMRRETERHDAEIRLAERRAALDAQTRAATELRVELARVVEKETRLREARLRLDEQCREHAGRIESLDGEKEALRLRGGARRDEAEALGSALGRNRAEEEELSRLVESQRSEANGLREAIEAAERRLAADRDERERAQAERAERDVAHAERILRVENTVTGIRERYQLELESVEIEPGDETELEARFVELQSKVDRLDRSQAGMEAVSELAEAEQRRDFLVAQKTDLEASIADLQKTIASLNRASRDRFAETFAAVDEKFQETFPKLFRGGKARLVLTDESNLLETGVDIHVQPPGMNLRTLSLLSGGQKALTAVSLIFSLFLTRPSPFCVLDEVDAPLDDANIDRFNQIVHEMGQQSQFLLITHNKRTMEVADTLYGVTMEDPGVSKIVSVRFQRAA